MLLTYLYAAVCLKSIPMMSALVGKHRETLIYFFAKKGELKVW